MNKHYRQGNLRVLAGAGLSVDSGFPSWGEMNRALLRKYIQEDLGSDPKAQPIIREHLDELVNELYEAIGRDAAADFVWNSSTRENFFEDLRRTLYRGRSIAELPLTQVHWQLASMDRATLFTTNFDPLLELARYRMNGGSSDDPDFAPYRSAHSPRLGTELDPQKVYHVHGWIDPDGICGGSFVLTESQYFELFSRQGQRPNQILDYVLTSGGAVLILGMSLADVNLRRHLYLRSRNRISDSTEIYAVLRVHGRELLDTYQTLHWANQGVRVVFIRDYHEVPRLLRDIKFGLPHDPAAPLPWMSQTLDWVQRNLPMDVIFSDKWQVKARSALLQLLSTLRESFAIPQNETVQATLLGQVSLQEIAVFAETRHASNGREARQYAQQFRLRVSGGFAQGVAGVAFSQG
ncbi:MAG: SIR2 family protein, partial [Acidobacteriaceae bacterium]|nr:SIR2 family protein [Acidobacteriaceae bacterium]